MVTVQAAFDHLILVRTAKSISMTSRKYQDKIKEFVSPILEQVDLFYRQHVDNIVPLVKRFIDEQKLTWSDFYINFADVDDFLGEVSSAHIDGTFEEVEVDWLTRLASFFTDFLSEYKVPAEYAWLIYGDVWSTVGDYVSVE